MSLRKMYILLLLDKVVNRCQFYVNRCRVQLRRSIVFCLLDLSISERGVLKFPTVIEESTISPCSSIGFCLMQFDAVLLGAYTSRIVMTSWRVDLFVICSTLLYP